MRERLASVTAWMNKNNIAAAFVNSTENVFYLSNFYTDPHERLMGIFVFKQAQPLFVLPAMEAGQLKDAGWEYEIIGYSDHENPWELIKTSLETRDLAKAESVAIEKEFLSYGRSEAFLAFFPEAKVVSVEDKLNEMRVVKDEKEIAIIRRAAKMADFGVQVGVDALKEGISEMEVLAKIEFELKKKGIREMSFSTMVLFGEQSGDPHGNPGDRKLKAGDVVLFDLGVILDGYCSDITRTVAFKSVTEKQKEIYNTVLKAELASLELSKPGTRIGDLDKIARDLITEAGYGDYFPHRIGHGMGINVHEFPSMSHLNDGIVREGMVYTIEPGIYLPGIGGVRIEDDVLVTADGFETLTKFPKELQIIE
ncbi:peptidase M24 family protein [Virgibacillus profundi]|uniref:Peptidase M24 family protein n=1 Tax=Virgibacillus profundi TaxID=2024555 RepID=A0A2A2I9M1_9BACI|nr:Xaa-Pro peptidase family protein [Virgibacillus profundi]PAV27974.1 peptidase M24 family protein [Virgibacillus profundi]PXY52152.1 aminopeptidase P family protein [Virgibacillus profundi]